MRSGSFRFGPFFAIALASLFTPSPPAASLPNGAAINPRSAECWPDQALQALQSTASLPKKMKAVQGWIDRCEVQWSSMGGIPVVSLLRYTRRRYSDDQPYIKKLFIPLKDGRKLRGIFGRKPGDKPRDLVVMRCG